MRLVTIHTEAVVNLEDYELQNLLTTETHLTALGDESVDHLLREGDLTEARHHGTTITLRFAGVRVIDGEVSDGGSET